jgi:alanyl-tRNA synthetase
MTERLYYNDSYLTTFAATVLDRDGAKIYLDRTAFYPTSGGQPFDTGSIDGAAVVDVIDEGDRIAHVVEGPTAADSVQGHIDWPRRFDHMQQHSGQHLLSAVIGELFGVATLSVHFGIASSTVDVETPSFTADQLRAAERRANELVFENRPLGVIYAENSAELGLRKASGRAGQLRVVEIAGLDRSACGGTHVRATGEIGPIFLRKVEKIRGSTRVEFLCGLRAISRARADFDALAGIAQTFSSPLDEAQALVESQMESLKAAEKEKRRLEEGLGQLQGRVLYDATAADGVGVRRVVKRAASGGLDPLRFLAQGFCARSMAVFLGVVEQPPQLLLATSADSGIDAGKLLKAALTAAGGRGGGATRMAQGSAPSADALEIAVQLLTKPA